MDINNLIPQFPPEVISSMLASLFVILLFVVIMGFRWQSSANKDATVGIINAHNNVLKGIAEGHRAEIDSMNRAIRNFKKMVEGSNDLARQADRKADGLQLQVTDLSKENDMLREENKKVKAENAEQAQKIQQQNERLLKQTQEIITLNKTKQDQQTVIQKQIDTIAEKTQENSVLMERLAKYDKELHDIKQRLDQTPSIELFNTLVQTVSSLKESVDSLNKQIAKQQENDTHQASIDSESVDEKQ